MLLAGDDSRFETSPMATSILISIPTKQWDWLQSMTRKHQLKDISKAMRICITCHAVGDVNSGDTAAVMPMENLQEREIELSSLQIDYIQRNYSDVSTAVTCIVDACANADEYTVFGVVRCKSSIVKCKGAQDAVIDIGKRYEKDVEEVMVDAKEDIEFRKNAKE